MAGGADRPTTPGVRPPVLAIAHRAGNSLRALREAMAIGADIIEADVHHHRGNLEVRHLKTAGPLPFLWDRWELTKASAPRLGLAELLAAEDRSMFMLDVKGRSLSAARSIATMLHQHGHHRPVIVCSRHWRSVDALDRVPWVRGVLSARNRIELERLRARLDRDPPSYGVALHCSLLSQQVIMEFRQKVEVVMTWPINDQLALDGVLALGVNAVITDDVAILRRVLGSR